MPKQHHREKGWFGNQSMSQFDTFLAKVGVFSIFKKMNNFLFLKYYIFSIWVRLHGFRSMLKYYSWIFIASKFWHISVKTLKWPEQNDTQEKIPFSGTIFRTLSHGVFRCSKNHLLTGWNSFTANQKLLYNGFWRQHSL